MKQTYQKLFSETPEQHFDRIKKEAYDNLAETIENGERKAKVIAAVRETKKVEIRPAFDWGAPAQPGDFD